LKDKPKHKKWLDRTKLKQMYQARQEELSLEQLNNRTRWRGQLKHTIAAAKNLEHTLHAYKTERTSPSDDNSNRPRAVLHRKPQHRRSLSRT
jgi:hypothetical protein